MEYPKKDRFGIDNASTFRPLRIAVLIISDSRTLETDTSGLYLSEALSESGHKCVSRQIMARRHARSRDAIARESDRWVLYSFPSDQF